MPSGLWIRSAVADDADDLFRFVAALTEAHFPGQAPWTSAAQLRADGFGADPLFEAFMAELDGEAVGMVSFFRGYAGMRGKAMGIVHALYVAPSARRLGAAQSLMAAVAAIALKRGWCGWSFSWRKACRRSPFMRRSAWWILAIAIFVSRARP